MEREPGDSSSSSCTYTESYCDEGEVYVCLGAEDEGWNNGIEKCSPELSVFSGGEMGHFETEETPFQMEGECDVYLREMSPSSRSEEDTMRDSIFVYSAPAQFPDIVRARNSAFGSIFVRTSVKKCKASEYIRKTQPESQFSMMPWYLESFERNSERPTIKSSVFRAFEKRGIAKETSLSSESQWDVFPITKSALFSVHIQDRVHQTRKLTKIEERIVNAPVQVLKFTHAWPSGSSWTGHWDGLGMAGTGTYAMPHGVSYFGKMHDGMCHDDDATLLYPNGFKVLHCNYVNGELTDYQFQFPDNLEHEKENWGYCQYPDRRFWSEIQCGLKPGKLAQRTQDDPPRKIPENCYDTNDGFYNPKAKTLVRIDGELLRIPSCKEERWIKENCRKGFRDFTGFRPDLYENWYDNDRELINALLNMQKMHAAGQITYEELNQFYADCGILSSSSPFSRTKTASEMEFKKMDDSLLNSRRIILPYRLRKIYEGRESFKNQKRDPPNPNVKQKPPKKCCAPKPRRNASSEKMSGKIKFSEGNRTANTSTTNFSENVSRPTTKKDQKLSYQPSSYGISTEISGESDTSSYRRKLALENAKGIISDMINSIVLAERERHRDRFIRTQKIGNLPFGARDGKEKCVQVLEELYRSIPDKDEFCDSVPVQTCDLKKLAEDRFQAVRYWGKRIFTLSFDEKQ